MQTCTRRILVVDDQETDLVMMRRALAAEAPDIDVATSHGGTEAVDRIAGGEADLVLLDLHMPGLDGIDLLARARESGPASSGTSPPIILLSSSRSDADISRAYATQANAYVVKPADMSGYRALARSIGAFWGEQAQLPA